VKFVIAITVAALLAAGCAGRTDAGAAATPTPAPKTAAQLATAIKPDIKTVSEIVVWTEVNDPNKLLGRPHQYTSAATLIDDRTWPVSGDDFPKGHPCVHADPGVNCGATIEVFATKEDVTARFERIDELQKAAAWIGLEYLTIEGTVLLRVTGDLSPAVNRTYVEAFRKAF
jgi:hypothetical protein